MSNKELLFSLTKKDFRIDRFRAGGKGGQKQNKTSSGVRVTHIESGAVGESRESRSQHENREKAFRRCIESPTFKKWHKKKVSEMLSDREAVNKKVDRMMQPEFIKEEVFKDNRWVEVTTVLHKDRL